MRSEAANTKITSNSARGLTAVTTPVALDTLYQVETPEGIALNLRPAGVVPRMLAYAIDSLIRLVEDDLEADEARRVRAALHEQPANGSGAAWSSRCRVPHGEEGWERRRSRRVREAPRLPQLPIR